MGSGTAGRQAPWVRVKLGLQLEHRVRFSEEQEAQRGPSPTEQGMRPWQGGWL